MRINSASIGMESARSYRASKTVANKTTTTYQGGYSSTTTSLMKEFISSESYYGSRGSTGGQNSAKGQGDAQSLADQKDQEWLNYPGISKVGKSLRSSSSSTEEEIKQESIMYIFKLLFGRWREKLYGKETPNSLTEWATTPTNITETTETVVQVEESRSFSARGVVKTEDGREIDFNINVTMSRSFTQAFSSTVQYDPAELAMCDPLVLNLDCDAASISDQNFYFDLDADGIKDNIGRLGSGSGYLALDRNKDGEINDGSELFGARTGNGFGELAKLDSDGNGWIDENDQVWDLLKIWCMNEDGTSSLYTLKEKNVGAIYLGNIDTSQELTNSAGDINGRVRRTGVFLYENGIAGTIQHVDQAILKDA